VISEKFKAKALKAQGRMAKSMAHGAWGKSTKGSRLKAESSKGAFGCWRSALLEVGGRRQKRDSFHFS
jgi:hypothetical protein